MKNIKCMVCAFSAFVAVSISAWSFVLEPVIFSVRSYPSFLIVDVSTCGVGNQMFHYAAGMGYARQNMGYVVCVLGLEDDVINAGHNMSVFRLVVDVIDSPLESCPSNVSGRKLPFFKRGINIGWMEYFTPPHSMFKPFEIGGGRSVFVEGCMQSYKYFQSVPHPFFRPKQLDAAKAWMSNRTGISSVVHVRRGDKVMDGSVVAPVEYYEKVLRMLGTSYVAVCTDDPAWVRQQRVFQNATISSGEPSFDMALMASATEAVVIGTGTFGWWGAYLSNAKRKYFYRLQYTGELANGYREQDYIPRGVSGQGQWIGLI